MPPFCIASMCKYMCMACVSMDNTMLGHVRNHSTFLSMYSSKQYFSLWWFSACVLGIYLPLIFVLGQQVFLVRSESNRKIRRR